MRLPSAFATDLARTSFRCVLVLIAVAFLGQSVLVAKDRGMDRTFQILDLHFVAMGIALSQVDKGMPGRFIGHTRVLDAVAEVMKSQNTPEDRALHRFRNGEAIVAAVRDLELSEQAKQSGPIIAQDTPNDIGYVDFLRFAFLTFGLKFGSLYLFYFAILALSMLTFVVAHRDDTAALAALALYSVAFCLVLSHSGIFADDRHQLYSVHDYRFVSSLVIVPALHLAFSMLGQRPPTAVLVLADAGQIALALLAIWFRGSALWTMLALGILFVAMLGASTWRRALIDEPTRHVAVRIGLTTLGLWLVGSSVTQYRVDDIYRTDPRLSTGYAIWHAAYVGLAADESTWRRRKTPRQVEGLADINGYIAVETRLRQEGRPVTDVFIAEGGVNWREYGRVVRQALFDYVSASPLDAIVLHVWHKPRAYARFVAGDLAAMAQSLGLGGIPYVLTLAAVIAGLVAVEPASAAPRLLAVMGAMVVGSGATAIFAYTLPHGMACQILVMATALLVFVAVGLADATRIALAPAGPDGSGR